jgi:hypothetical protein
MDKKRVAILFSGQMRVNGLNPDYTNDNIVLDSINNFFLNETFKEKYNYDVFISTDNVDIQKAKDFFGEDNIKNVFLYEKNWYLRPIKNDIKPFKYYEDEFSKNDFFDLPNHSHALFMVYRLYTVYNLMKNYQEETGTNYEYVVKIRPDSVFKNNTNQLFDSLETTNKKIICEHDHFVITKYEFSEIFSLMETYGKYNASIFEKIDIYQFLTRDNSFNNDDYLRFCPEKQFMDNIFDILKIKNNLDFHESFYGIVYPSYTALYRGNGVYGYT